MEMEMKEEKNYYDVYLLFSIINPYRVYIGFTNNLDRRLRDHNQRLKDCNSKVLFDEYPENTIEIYSIYTTPVPITRKEIKNIESEYIKSYVIDEEFEVLNILNRNGVYNPREYQKQRYINKKEEKRKYRQQNIEKIKEYEKQRYIKNKQSIRERKIQRYNENRESILKRKKEYRQRNVEKIKEYEKQRNNNKKMYLDWLKELINLTEC